MLRLIDYNHYLFIYIMMQSYYFFRKNEGKNSLIDR